MEQIGKFGERIYYTSPSKGKNLFNRINLGLSLLLRIREVVISEKPDVTLAFQSTSVLRMRLVLLRWLLGSPMPDAIVWVTTTEDTSVNCVLQRGHKRVTPP